MLIRQSLKLVSTLALALAMLTLTTNVAAASSAVSPAAQSGCRGRVGTSITCPAPIRFARASYGALVNGTITTTSFTRYYSVSAKAGQHMTLTFTGTGGMRGSVRFPGGSGGGGPYYGNGDVIALPSNGVYIIQVGANTMAGNPWNGRFTMAVLVR